MTRTQLLTIAEAATVIEAATGRDRFDVANDINIAAWTHHAKPGHGERLEVYTDDGRLSTYNASLYGVNADHSDFADYVPGLYRKVHLLEVLSALGYHSDVASRIMATWEAEVPPAGSMPAATDWKQQVRDEATRWCRERSNNDKSQATKTAVIEEMEVWCRNHGIKTDTGIHPSREYIRRHVLKGWKHP